MKPYNAHIAAYNFASRDVANWNHDRYGAPAPVDSDFGYKHGWITLEGQTFRREDCMKVGAPIPSWVS